MRASREGRIAVLCANESEWCEELSRLCSSPGLREAIGRAARRDVCDRYGVEAQADELISVLAEILERGPEPPRGST